jgi:cell division protein ZapA (FtsZ GTPase activity inhibitor)
MAGLDHRTRVSATCYNAGMNAKDELAALRAFLTKLRSGDIRLRRRKRDVTAQETAILEREAAHLEAVIERSVGAADA